MLSAVMIGNTSKMLAEGLENNMPLTIDFWWMIGFAITLIGAFWGLVKLLTAATLARLDERFGRMHERLDRIQNDQKITNEELRILERDQLNFKTEVAKEFVRREDYNKDLSAIFTRIDALSLKIDNLFLKNRHGGKDAD